MPKDKVKARAGDEGTGVRLSRTVRPWKVNPVPRARRRTDRGDLTTIAAAVSRHIDIDHP